MHISICSTNAIFIRIFNHFISSYSEGVARKDEERDAWRILCLLLHSLVLVMDTLLWVFCCKRETVLASNTWQPTSDHGLTPKKNKLL